MKTCRRLISILVVATLAGCVTAPAPQRYCSNDSVLIDTNFEGGNFAACEIGAANNISILIRPEDDPPINPSPWYSFRVTPRAATTARITLTFEEGYARYWPKLSHDGHSWTPAADALVSRSETDNSLTLDLALGHQTIYVSGQELVTTPFYYSWIRELDARDDISTRLVGASVQGRPIFAAKTGNQDEVVLLLGRQHPPEVTGAFAMRAFVDAVLGESELARRFRARFAIVIVPIINPDGVALGHWRHNVNGVDLNRDWGPFTQPETRAVAEFLDEQLASGARLRLMLDFHSTRTNTFYTQLAEETNYAFDFATVWLERVRSRIPEFTFTHDARARSGQANTKNYFFDTYGIPAITYELGDETDRDEIAITTPVFAEEMMRTLLEVGD